MVLRSDEAANQAEIERDKRFRGNVGAGLAAAGTYGVVNPLSARIMPFLNQYIPANLAMKGIEKVSPRLGAFLKKGQEMGLNVEEGLDFIKEKFGQQEAAKENRNIIEQESPELHQFIDQEIKKGKKPIQAAAVAQKDKRFSSIIEKLMKTHKIPWSQIIESIYGNGEMAQPNAQQAEQQQLGPIGQMLTGQGQQSQQMPMQQGQSGQGQQALLAIMQKINQKLGK